MFAAVAELCFRLGARLCLLCTLATADESPED
jgi:hypothetical protein